MKSFMSRVQNRYRQGMQHKAASLDSETRSELVNEIQSSLAISSTIPTAQAETDELQQIETSLEQARDRLTKFEKKEVFISTRIQSYRDKLDQQKKQLIKQGEEGTTPATRTFQNEESETFKDEDEEQLDNEEQYKNTAEWHQMERDEEALEQVVETHKTLMADIEDMKRHVCEMEYKRHVMLRQREECREFVVAAQMAQHEQDMMQQEFLYDGNVSASYQTVSTANQDDDAVGDDEVARVSNSNMEMRRRTAEKST